MKATASATEDANNFDNIVSVTSDANVVSSELVASKSRVDDDKREDGASSDISLILARVLTRQVKISTIDLAVGVAQSGIIYPYDLLLSNAFIADKIANYNGLRAGIKLSIRVSATAFHYGAVQFAYLPLHDYRRNGMFDLANDNSIMQLSQANVKGLLPLTGSSAIELEVPYVYPRDFIGLRGEFLTSSTRSTAAATYQGVGALIYKTYTPLSNASTSTDSVTVYITATLTDPVLSLPTTQSNEAADGPISYVASSVARVAGYAEKWKPISRYARATREVADHLGGIARVFGFSRPVELSPPKPMKPEFFGSLANTDQNENSHVLSLDSQCELAITPDTVRLDLPDELQCEYFCARESFIDKHTYAVPSIVSTAPDVWIPVSPEIVAYHNALSTLTPCSYASQLFSKWRGMMVYRLKMVKSQVHTGRLQIRHDALASSAGTSSSITELKTTFWNLGDTDEIEICVPWLQGSEFLPLLAPAQSDHNLLTTTIPTLNASLNGALQISVVSDIVCSTTATSNIEMLVFARLEQAEFMGPADNLYRWSLPSSQSGCDPAHQDLMGCDKRSNPVIYGGERVASLRTIMKRYARYYGEHYVSDATRRISRRYFPREPGYPGLVPNGDGRNSQSVLLLKESNLYSFTPTSWLSACFALQRGSVRYKANFSHEAVATPYAMLAMNRSPYTITSFNSDTALTGTGTDSFIWGMGFNAPNGAAGMDFMVDGFPQCETNVPHYNHNSAAISCKQGPLSFDGSLTDNFELCFVPTKGNADTTYNLFEAAGSDYNLFYFEYIPMLDLYAGLMPE